MRKKIETGRTTCGVREDVKIRDLSSTAAQKIFQEPPRAQRDVLLQDRLAAPLIEAIEEYFEWPEAVLFCRVEG